MTLNEIKENLIDMLQHTSDCYDSDDYRNDVPWLIARVERLENHARLIEDLCNSPAGKKNSAWHLCGGHLKKALEEK